GAAAYIRLRRRVSLAVRAEDNVYETDRIASPFVLGLFRPRIYVPTGLESPRYAHILAHERTHIRRRDPHTAALAYLALALHWFNPLVWAAYTLMLRDMESSCDEAVLRSAGEDIRREYSAALLSVASVRRGLPIPLAFGEQGVKERIQNVLNFKKPSRIITFTAALLGLVLTVGLVLNRAEAAQYNSVLDRVDAAQIETVHIQIGNETRDAAGAADIAKYVAALKDLRLTEKADPAIYGSLAGGVQRLDVITFADGTDTPMTITPMAPYVVIDGVVYLAETEAVNRLDYTAYLIFGYEGADAADFGIERVPAEIGFYAYADDPAAYGMDTPLGAPIPQKGAARLTLSDYTQVRLTCEKGTVSGQLYYAEDGSGAEPRLLGGTDAVTSTVLWRLAEEFPIGFQGSVWAVTSDADGAPRLSEIVKVRYDPGLLEFEAITTSLREDVHFVTFARNGILYSGYILGGAAQSEPGGTSGLNEIGFAVSQTGEKYRIFEREGYGIDEFIVVLDSGFMNPAMIYAAASSAMSLNDVRAIAREIGAELTLGDLRDFVGTDVGSGLHVMQYDVQGGAYRLTVGAGDLSGPVLYANLGRVTAGVMDENAIDIRYYDIEAYLRDGTRAPLYPEPGAGAANPEDIIVSELLAAGYNVLDAHAYENPREMNPAAPEEPLYDVTGVRVRYTTGAYGDAVYEMNYTFRRAANDADAPWIHGEPMPWIDTDGRLNAVVIVLND
ncbi:MAG: M56 family metallopeptidase, partial [Oscillospiraceae bacterium]|nr:M56 family metallopeptidase [Oscillospiraceae bacterium]